MLVKNTRTDLLNQTKTFQVQGGWSVVLITKITRIVQLVAGRNSHTQMYMDSHDNEPQLRLCLDGKYAELV